LYKQNSNIMKISQKELIKKVRQYLVDGAYSDIKDEMSDVASISSA